MGGSKTEYNRCTGLMSDVELSVNRHDSEVAKHDLQTEKTPTRYSDDGMGRGHRYECSYESGLLLDVR